MMTDDDVQLKRNNKKLLEKLRNEEPHVTNDTISSGGHATSREGSRIEDETGVEGFDRGSQGGPQGTPATDGTAQRRDTGIRPADSESFDTHQSTYPAPLREQVRSVETPEEKKARQNELARQKQQRYRDKEAAKLAQNQPENVTQRNVTDKKPVTSKLAFDIKNPLSKLYGDEKVKLFSKTEAEEALPNLTDMYEKLSALPDEILEIIVKDHEPVQIWKMSTEEAGMFAEAKLRRAQTNEQDAREARKLLDIYDRIYFYLWMYPRLQATGRHVITHKGFSFK